MRLQWIVFCCPCFMDKKVSTVTGVKVGCRLECCSKNQWGHPLGGSQTCGGRSRHIGAAEHSQVARQCPECVIQRYTSDRNKDENMDEEYVRDMVQGGEQEGRNTHQDNKATTKRTKHRTTTMSTLASTTRISNMARRCDNEEGGIDMNRHVLWTRKGQTRPEKTDTCCVTCSTDEQETKKNKKTCPKHYLWILFGPR